MLILNAGAHKSGSTWLEGIIKALPLGLTRPPNHDYSNAGDRVLFMAERAAYGRCFTFKAHLGPKEFETQESFQKAACKPELRAINIVRDARDVLTSLYHHMRGVGEDLTLDEFFSFKAQAAFDRWAAHNHFWLRTAPALFATKPLNLCYEAMKQNFERETRRLTEYLGCEMPDDLAGRVSISTMRETSTKPWMKSFEERGGNFFRKGIVGDYANFFTDDMSAKVQAWFGDSPKAKEVETWRVSHIEKTST
jgi:hypothetical protein